MFVHYASVWPDRVLRNERRQKGVQGRDKGDESSFFFFFFYLGITGIRIEEV